MPDDSPGADSGAAETDRPADSGPREPSAPTPSFEPAETRGDTGSGETGGADDSAESADTDRPEPPPTERPAEPGPTAGTAPPHRAGGRIGRLPRLAAWVAAAVAVVLVAGVGTAYGYYHSLQGNILRHDLDEALNEEDRPEKIGDDLNILFIGSDGREGGNSVYGGRDFVGERSDALMLAHISTDGRVTVVNFPRDSLVRLPECEPYGETDGTPGYHGMINAALFHGGPPCVVKTVESLTGIRIDHFAHLSFGGFREMIDAIGGVQICIPRPMHDERAQLDLEAGRQVLDGEEALSFVRARYEIGNGSDIGRIDRQQMFLGALADEVAGSDLLTRPGRTTEMLTAITEHTGTDGDFTLPTMISIASTLAGTELSDIAFYTVPWQRAPLDPNRVVWDESAAARLFSAIRHDRPVEDRLLVSGQEGADGPAADPDQAGAGHAAGRDAQPHGGGAAEPSPAPGAGEATAGPGEPIKGRDATSNPCANGLGHGTQSGGESAEPQL
ncbi:LytR family transcriptional regulator [Streptomonospora sp. PA3]|uniref:LCP family protein n=1 Tax=Streptomonospora sp. PA3 TaxID=2607326 RepID=UPI0012DF75F6|nr:LCP family protein [Streptomonospora sp. PA3]MUL41333.1 LytR family transcriptional regulator [Streptomonospora sp. PA3]